MPFWRHHEGKDAFLFSPEEALERVTFPDTREVLEKVLARLDSFYLPAGRRGQWKMEFSPNGRMLVDIEKRGKPSKWLTLWALGVLKGAYG